MIASPCSSPKAVALELSRRLQTIRQAAGAMTDLGLRVTRGKVHVTAEDVPCLTIVEGSEEVKGRVGSAELTCQRYALVAYLRCDPEQPNDAAHDGIRDIKRAVFADGATWGGMVRGVPYTGRNIGPQADARPSCRRSLRLLSSTSTT
jgi:hypothetical protein